MKAMNSELQMYKAQLSEYKYEIEGINGRMQTTKKQWFAKQKQQADLAEAEAQAEGEPDLDMASVPGVGTEAGGLGLDASLVGVGEGAS